MGRRVAHYSTIFATSSHTNKYSGVNRLGKRHDFTTTRIFWYVSAAGPKNRKDCEIRLIAKFAIRHQIQDHVSLSFPAIARADLPMVARWLGTPEVLRWWGDPKEQIDLITEDLDEPLMRQWIVEHQSRAFAYMQAYPANAWPQTHLTHLPNGAVVIDAFIGEPAMLGCGHGSAFLHVVGEKLLAEGAPIVAIDPDR
jgi:aminoglycoside 6'-N-acetyltransferase